MRLTGTFLRFRVPVPGRSDLLAHVQAVAHDRALSATPRIVPQSEQGRILGPSRVAALATDPGLATLQLVSAAHRQGTLWLDTSFSETRPRAVLTGQAERNRSGTPRAHLSDSCRRPRLGRPRVDTLESNCHCRQAEAPLSARRRG